MKCPFIHTGDGDVANCLESDCQLWTETREDCSITTMAESGSLSEDVQKLTLIMEHIDESLAGLSTEIINSQKL